MRTPQTLAIGFVQRLRLSITHQNLLVPRVRYQTTIYLGSLPMIKGSRNVYETQTIALVLAYHSIDAMATNSTQLL